MTEKTKQALLKLLQQAHAAVLDPSSLTLAKAAKLLDRAMAKLEAEKN